MTDLTLLYYSARRISDRFSGAVIAALLQAAPAGAPIVTVAHGAPFTFGAVNLSVGTPEPSIWQVYQNVLTAARAAATPYVACVEDDSLYCREHFTHRPPLDTFAYNRHRWVLTRQLSPDGRRRQARYYYRDRTQMAQCVAPRDLLIETLEERFAKYPTPVPHDVAKRTGWGEPGRYEKNLGLTRRALTYFRTVEPNVTVNHALGLMGRRQVHEGDLLCDDLDPWGGADALWSQLHGD